MWLESVVVRFKLCCKNYFTHQWPSSQRFFSWIIYHPHVGKLERFQTGGRSTKYKRHTDPNGGYDQSSIKQNKGLNREKIKIVLYSVLCNFGHIYRWDQCPVYILYSKISTHSGLLKIRHSSVYCCDYTLYWFGTFCLFSLVLLTDGLRLCGYNWKIKIFRP